MSSNKHISIIVGGKSYPIVVTSDEEHLVRRAEKDINEGILDFQKKYAGININDCIAMMLITKSVDMEKIKNEEIIVQTSISDVFSILKAANDS